MNTFRIFPHVFALAAAYALAVPIGWDRELAGRSAGLRTFPLVAIASCGFIQATETERLQDGPWTPNGVALPGSPACRSCA